MVYTKEVENMCCVAKGPNHGPAPIPEEGRWIQAKEIKDIFSEEPAALPEKTEAKSSKKAAKKEQAAPAKELTFTDVRAKLARKSREGFTADIKEILRSRGAEKLSDIQPADYEAVLKEVEELTHE